MPKSKLTLIVDGNWLLMSRLGVMSNRFKDDFELCHELQLMMIKSINIVLKTFHSIDNIIVVADGGSWRSNLEIPECLHHDELGKEAEYKGTRERDESINWDLIFTTYEDFLSILSSTGITISREKDVEGDDWCYHWSRYLNSIGTNVMIWSRDNDLKQLVKIDHNKCFTVWWHKEDGLYTDEYNEEDMNFLFNNSFNENESILNELTIKSNKVVRINPKTIIIEKIIRGDGSDNILPVLVKEPKTKGGRQYKVTHKEIDYNLDYNDQNKVQEYFNNILQSKSWAGRVNKSIEDILKHFEYNRTLVFLDKSVYPKNILEIFDEHKDFNISNNIMLAESQIQATSNKLKNILDII